MKLLLQESITEIHCNNGQQPSPFMCKIRYPSNWVSGCDPVLNSSGVLSLDKVSLLSFREDPIKSLNLLSSYLLLNLFCLFLRHTFLTVFKKWMKDCIAVFASISLVYTKCCGPLFAVCHVTDKLHHVTQIHYYVLGVILVTICCH